MKSERMTFCTSGRRSNSAVGVVCSRSFGARRSGDGEGSEVKNGFCARAAAIVLFEVGGVTSVMSVTPAR